MQKNVSSIIKSDFTQNNTVSSCYIKQRSKGGNLQERITEHTNLQQFELQDKKWKDEN